MKDFRRLFREYLISEGVSHTDAARRLGITQQALSRMVDEGNETAPRSSSVAKALIAFPAFKFFAADKLDPSIGKQAADNFEYLMEHHSYFRAKVEAHGQKMILEYLEKHR